MGDGGERPRVIVQILGGLGNQMFCYAAARRLAIANGARLVLDTTSRLINDPYKRRYLLDRFRVEGEIQHPSSGCHRGWRKARRSVMRRVARRTGGMSGRYLFELGRGFVPAMLDVRVDGFVNLDGLWQDPRYFEDVVATIREDFRLAREAPADVRDLGETMRGDRSSVSVHLRSYKEVPHSLAPEALGSEFVRRAMEPICAHLSSPRVYLFTDDGEWARRQVREAGFAARVVDVNTGRGDDGAVLDMWLMSRCAAHVVSNSTFSWWGAWLDEREPLVVGPRGGLPGNQEAFPASWLQV
jgi:hypothetical protein